VPTQAIIPVTPGSGLDLDAVSLIIGANTVYREVLCIADPTNATNLATVNGSGALNVADAVIGACITANVLAVALPTAQITALTPPSAGSIGTAVAADLLIGTQVAGSSVPVALPTATITTLTPPTAGAIAAAIVANPPTTFGGAVTNVGTFAVQATLAAETTKVIGTVNQGTSPWVVSNGGTFAVQATLSAETTKVIGTIRVTGNVGGVMDTTLGATKPANVLQVGGNDGTNAYALPLASGGGKLLVTADAITIAAAQTIAVTQATAASLNATVVGTVTANQGTAAATPWTDRPGAPTTGLWTSAVITFSSSGDNTIIAGSGSTTIRIMRIFFVNSNGTTATNVTFKDSTPTSLSGAFLLNSGGSFNGSPSGEPLFVTASGKGFVINSSAAVQISGTVWYTQT
jgi:hypothetical protein